MEHARPYDVTLGIVALRGSVAFLASILLHGGLVSCALLSHRCARAVAEPRLMADPMAGNTFDIEALLPNVEASKAGSEPPANPRQPARSSQLKAAPKTPAPEKAPTAKHAGARSTKIQTPPAEPKADIGKTPEPPAGAQPAAGTQRADSRPGKARSNGDGQQTKPAAAAATGPAPASAPAATTTGTAAPKYGAAGLPPGVRLLSKAFTRAITAATNRDPYWHTLALGDVGTIRLEIQLDDTGRISASSTEKDKETIAAPLKRLVERTMLLLKRGRFALSPDQVGAGSEAFVIKVRLTQGAQVEDYDDPRHTVSLGFTPPTPKTPGRAYFVQGAASGRSEADVRRNRASRCAGPRRVPPSDSFQ